MRRYRDPGRRRQGPGPLQGRRQAPQRRRCHRAQVAPPPFTLTPSGLGMCTSSSQSLPRCHLINRQAQDPCVLWRSLPVCWACGCIPPGFRQGGRAAAARIDDGLAGSHAGIRHTSLSSVSPLFSDCCHGARRCRGGAATKRPPGAAAPGQLHGPHPGHVRPHGRRHRPGCVLPAAYHARLRSRRRVSSRSPAITPSQSHAATGLSPGEWLISAANDRSSCIARHLRRCKQFAGQQAVLRSRLSCSF